MPFGWGWCGPNVLADGLGWRYGTDGACQGRSATVLAATGRGSSELPDR